MDRYALLGWPVKHSVSPQMQGAGFAAVGIQAGYELIEVPPQDLGSCMVRLRDAGYAGWNITVPHKEHALDYIDSIDPGAAAAGSVNTVVNREGRLHGYSTDGYGLARALDESFGMPVHGRRFLFLGTGGAARATSVHFAREGAAGLLLVNRTLEKALKLAETVAAAAPDCPVRCLALDDIAAITAGLHDVDCLIQATSLGLHPGDPVPLDPERVPAGVAVMDMIYRKTPFLSAVSSRGCAVADGRGMLLHQGVRCFELWTGRQGPVEAMRVGLEQALAARLAAGS